MSDPNLTPEMAEAHELTVGELHAVITLVRQHCTVCKPGTLPRFLPKLEAIRDRLAATLGDTGQDAHQ